MEAETSGIRCEIKAYRRRKGFSQDELAQRVGVRRQAIYDMEAGRYLPNTAVALRLARVLGCSVEGLFGESPQPDTGEVQWVIDHGAPGQRLALARVCDKLVGVPLDGATAFRLEAADGLLRADRTVECRISQRQLASTVLVLGCDPALSLLGSLVQRVVPATRAHTLFASSGEALRALAGQRAHVAGIHYHSSAGDEGNLQAVRIHVPGRPCLMLALAEQEEGLMVARGNPFGLRAVDDLAGGSVRLVNREHGAALRVLLEAQLAEHGVPVSALEGYDDVVRSHSEGAMRVAARSADAALGLRVVAEAFGLDFVPLAVTRCDLVIPADCADHAGVAALLDCVQSAVLRNDLCALPGYDVAVTGKRVDTSAPVKTTRTVRE